MQASTAGLPLTQERFPDEPGYEDAWDEALAWLHACGPGVDLQLGDPDPTPSPDPADTTDGIDPLAAVEGVLLDEEGAPDDVGGFGIGSEVPHKAEGRGVAAGAKRAWRAGFGGCSDAEVATAGAPKLAVIHTAPMPSAVMSRGGGGGAGSGQALGRRMLTAHTQELARQQRVFEAHAVAAWGRMGVAAC